ncbi:MAG: inositol polyphosphate kinase family protein [Candidatus Endonucleobacter bathymodioli]|uniref:Inositol polyphosphate kinase family protein n=1 Tax=Candidatus Endonucleibacter bathymodioli TaxID=539814 RepID=A0AA90P0E2_9GAMM|nr:inositol polyphosphate kinase family protein [Candidatus Endonucleobacter bathymodioli]
MIKPSGSHNEISSLDIESSKFNLKKAVQGLWKKYIVGMSSSKKKYSLDGSSGVLNNQDGRHGKNIADKPLFYRKVGGNNMVLSKINEDDEQSEVLCRGKSKDHLLKAKSRGAVAGHADKLVSLKYCIAKVTTDAEYDVYQNRDSNGLDSIIPKTKLAENLTPEEQSSIKDLEGQRGANEKILIMDKSGAMIDNKDKRELDIKIGSSTASVSQLEKSGSSKLKAICKKVKHKILDHATGSTENKYRLEGLNINGHKPIMSRIFLSRNSTKHIYNALNITGGKRAENIDKITKELMKIKDTLGKAGVTFVASSVLIVIDEKNPANTTVKLIDPAHPLKEGEDLTYQKTKDRFLHGVQCLIDDIQEMKF